MFVPRCLIRPVLVLLVLQTLGSAGLVQARAEESRLPTSREEIRLSYAPLVKKAAPAVVNIYTKRIVQARRSPFMNDPFFRQFFGDAFNFGVPRQRVQNSLGSGVIVRPEGIIVTNNHVVEKADEITVVLADRRELPAKIVLTDERTDIAVLHVDAGGERLPFLALRDSDDLEVGDLVLAIGNPFGVGQTVTSGIVSALARVAEGVSDFSFFIQTDAAINPGNSGGALVTMDGKLAGVNTAIFSKSGGSMGIGFAIPSNMVARVVDNALHGAKIVRPWFGASGQEVTSDIAASLGLKRPVGVLINRLYPGGPADRAGLQSGDVVLALNGREIAEPKALTFRIATLGVGGAAKLTVRRAGRDMTLTVPLEAPPEIPPRNVVTIGGRNPFSGAVVANLSPALADELQLDQMQTGVIVLALKRGSRARRIGIEAGDIVIRVDGRDVDTVATLRALIEKGQAPWSITVRRNGETLSARVE